MNSSQFSVWGRVRGPLAVVCVAVAMLGGCSRFQSADSLLKNAQESLAKGDRAAAIIHLKNAIQKDTENGQVRFLLGKVYLENGDAVGAEKELRRALELNVDPVQVWPHLAKAMIGTQSFKQIVEQVPTDDRFAPPARAELMAVRATALLLLGKTDEAQKTFETALQVDPNAEAPLLGLARIAASRREFDKSLALVNKVVEKAPKNAEALLFRSDLERMSGDIAKASESAAKAVEADPKNTRARLVAGNLALAQGKLDEAAKQAEEIKKISPNAPSGLYLNALVQARKKDYRAAQDEIQKALKIAPRHLPSLLLAGAIEYSSGDYNQAEAHLKEVVSAAPSALYGKKLLAAVYLRTQRPARAIELLGPVADQGGEADVQAMLGEAYLQMGEFQKSALYFGKASESNPKNAVNLTGLAVSKLASGETDQAMGELESAVRLDTGRTQADLLLVLSRLNRGEYDKAMAAIDVMEQKIPKSSLPNVLRGQVAIAKRDFPGARKYLEAAEKLEPNEFQVVYGLARLDQAEKKFDDAQKRIEAFVAKNDKHIEAMIALAELKARASAPREQIIDLLKRAANVDPRLSRPQEILARYYLTQGMSKEALEAARKAQSAAPDAPSVLDALGTAQLSTGDANQAVATFSRLVNAQPHSAHALVRLAQAQEASGNRTAAANSAARAAQLDPSSSEALELAVSLSLYSQRPGEALALAQQAQKSNPKLPLGYMLEGDILVAQKRPQDAIARYDQALKLVSSPMILMRKHRALLAAGKAGEADKLLQDSLAKFPKDIALLLYAGDVAIGAGQYDRAAEQLKKVLDAQPNNVYALNNMGWALHQRKDPKAVTYVEQALKLKPEHPSILDTYGVILKDSGHLDRAVQTLQKASSLAPGDNEIRFHYASALLAAGQKEEARRELDSLKRLGPGYARAAEVEQMYKQL